MCPTLLHMLHMLHTQCTLHRSMNTACRLYMLFTWKIHTPLHTLPESLSTFQIRAPPCCLACHSRALPFQELSCYGYFRPCPSILHHVSSGLYSHLIRAKHSDKLMWSVATRMRQTDGLVLNSSPATCWLCVLE